MPTHLPRPDFHKADTGLPRRSPFATAFLTCAMAFSAALLPSSSAMADGATPPPTVHAATVRAAATEGTATAKDSGKRGRIVRETGSCIDFDAAASHKRDEQIETLTRVIPRAQGLAKADLLFRLAELWWEKSKAAALAAVSDYDKALDDWTTHGEAEGAPEPRLEAFLGESDLFRHEALRTYGAILDGWPEYPRRDEVLFADAYNKGEIGRKDEAVQGYRKLVADHPESRFVFDAWLQLGELEFDAGHLALARDAYSKAMGSPAKDLRNFARYRLAWCDFNAGDDESAVAGLKAVVAEAGGAGLGREALNDLAGGFARLGDAGAALEWFPKNAEEDRARELVRKTAALLLKAGIPEQATKAFQWLMDTRPFDPKGPEDQRALIDALESRRDRDGVLEGLKTLAFRYGPGSEWAKANAGDPAALDRAWHVTEAAMRTLVTDYHEEAQRTRSAATYRVARDIYGEYLARFQDSPMAAELGFFYGEILWALGEYEAAGREYAAAARRDVHGARARDAAYDAVLAFEKALEIRQGKQASSMLADDAKVDEGKKKDALKKGDREALLTSAGARRDEGRPDGAAPSSPTPEVPTSLDGIEAALVDAIDLFAGLFPHDGEALAARYKAAHLLYQKRHDVEAARRLGDIIDEAPSDKWSRKAAALSLGLLERQEAWDQLDAMATRFAANPRLVNKDAAYKDRLEDLALGGRYKHLDLKVRPSLPDGKIMAAQGFARLAEENQSSRYAPQAAFYAMVLFQGEDRLPDAIRQGESLLVRWPDARRLDGGALVPETHRRLGVAHYQAARLSESAAHLDAFLDASGIGGKAKDDGRKRTSTPERGGVLAEGLPEALLLSATVDEALGRTDAAASRLGHFAALYPGRDEAPDAALRAARLMAREADCRTPPIPSEKTSPTGSQRTALQDASRALAKALSDHGDRISSEKRLAAMADLAEWSQGKDREIALADLEAFVSRLDDDTRKGAAAVDALARARFAALDGLFEDTVAIGFDDPRTVRRDLARKAKQVSQLEKGYLDVMTLGPSSRTLAALTRLGQLYGDFSQKLLDSPDPDGLTDEELDMYRSQLEEQAFPLEEKAVRAFEAGIAKGIETGAYDRWLLGAQEGLSRIRRGAFPPLRKAVSQAGAGNVRGGDER